MADMIVLDVTMFKIVFNSQSCHTEIQMLKFTNICCDFWEIYNFPDEAFSLLVSAGSVRLE